MMDWVEWDVVCMCVGGGARVRAKKITLELHHEDAQCYLCGRGGWANTAWKVALQITRRTHPQDIWLQAHLSPGKGMLGIPVVFSLSSTICWPLWGFSFQLQPNNPLLSRYLIGISFPTKGAMLTVRVLFVKNHTSILTYKRRWGVSTFPQIN